MSNKEKIVRLRDEFTNQLNIAGSVDLLFQDNNTDYIEWLETNLIESREKMETIRQLLKVDRELVEKELAEMSTEEIGEARTKLNRIQNSLTDEILNRLDFKED